MDRPTNDAGGAAVLLLTVAEVMVPIRSTGSSTNADRRVHSRLETLVEEPMHTRQCVRDGFTPRQTVPSFA
jgi:hypothetical protein